MSTTLCRLSAAAASARIGELADLLIDCVAGGASVSFMAGLQRPRAERFWQTVAEGVATGSRTLIVAEADGRIVGSVQLVLEQPDNQPHRADVAKMLVARHARRQGIGAALLRAAEREARHDGKTLLVLDTQAGGAGDHLYAALGWTRLGCIPGYALTPDGGACDAAFFYKALTA